MFRLLFSVVAALGVLVAQAGAEQYWIAYEGNDLPENEGWNRYWGDADGEYHGDGAIRTVQDGILTMDSLHDPWIYDFVYLDLPGEVDPDPGEVFVVEWRLRVCRVDGRVDPTIAVFSDLGWAIGFEFDENSIYSIFEEGVEAAIAPDLFHEYHLISQNMRHYQLCVDGELALTGAFWQGVGYSYVAWGDGVQPAASRSQWDYFRFGGVPEPETFSLLLAAASVAGRCNRRFRRCATLQS